MRNEPRDLEQALADLIKRRNTETLTPDQREMLNRMISDLEAEITWRRREKPRPEKAHRKNRGQ